MPIIEDLAAAHEQLGALPDPLGTVADDHHQRVRSQPAEFLQPRPQATEDAVGIPQATDQEAAEERMAPRGRFDALRRQQQHAGLDLAELALVHGRKRREGRPRGVTAAPVGAHLHPQGATIHPQHHHRGRLEARGGRAVTVGVVVGQRLSILLARFAQPLHGAPHAHRADLHPKAQQRQAGGQLVGHHRPQQGEQPCPRPADASRLHPESVQQRSRFPPAVRAAIAAGMDLQPPETAPPGDRPCIIRGHAPAALRAAGRWGRQRLGERFHPPLQGAQQGRTKLVLDFAFQLDEAGNLVGQHRPRSGEVIGRQVDRSAETVHGRLPFTARAACAAARVRGSPSWSFRSLKL